MTGILKDLMTERADAVEAPHVDVLAITRAGERRVRRRRTAIVGGVAAATLVVGLVGNALLPGEERGGREGRVAVDGTDASPQPLSWATDSTVHRAGMADIDLGADIRSWLWGGSAIAWTDQQRAVHLWTGGSQETLGATAAIPYGDVETELVTDGQRVGWLDADDGFVVHDTGTGTRQSLPWDATRGKDVLSRLTALDDSTAYGVDGRGVFAWDLGTGDVEVLDADTDRAVIDAESGVLLRKVDGMGVVVNDGREITFALDSFANLSPDGAVVTAESNDVGILVDTATGDRIPFETGRDWAMPFQWLDDDTVAVLAVDIVEGGGDDAGNPVLTTCSVRSGSCDPEGVAVEALRMELPIGVHFGDR